MAAFEALSQILTLPDLWQQEALRALRGGKDVVVHAPTGAGKTHIFELFQPNLKGQAIFTVPTRALANDKLSEWQKRGWDVGIATGDVALRLDAKVLVATLETQKGCLLERKGPALLVIDEYQMIGDPNRGVNYELAVALAPPETQLLLLSGSVANPKEVVAWLQRIGRDAVLISHAERPVPLQEIDVTTIPERRSASGTAWWPRMISNAVQAGLGPVLLFAPRRNAAEELALQTAVALPPDRPLSLTLEQRQLAGSRLAKLLEARVAFHHSGLSYAQRAGLIEPLAKAGELRVVVATMGLAAGINFSMRSVAITGTTYMAGNFERQVQPDELLQMFGRAGRRGLDDMGYALVGSRPPRLFDARPRQLRRSQQIDWPTLIAVMRGAAPAGRDPFAAAREVNERLFTLQNIPLGVEHSLATGPMPCGLLVDMERARFARRGMVEMLNSRGVWEAKPGEAEEVTLGDALVSVTAGQAKPEEEAADAGEERAPAKNRQSWRPALSVLSTISGLGLGNVCKLPPRGAEARKWYGREVSLGTRRGGKLALAPWLKRFIGTPLIEAAKLESDLLPRISEIMGGAKLAAVFPRGEQLVAQLSFEDRKVSAWRDSLGRFLIDPPERRELPLPCRTGVREEGHSPSACPELPWCLSTEITNSAAFAWRRLGLIERDGSPTRRGIVFSFFQRGEGLAIAAALEDESYDLDALIFDLANLRAGPRFAGDDPPHSGRLAGQCQNVYERADFPGYLEMGVPPEYGAGASEAIRALVEHGVSRQKLLTEFLRIGDVERAMVEWRSLLRHIAHAPDFDWERWRLLKEAASGRLAIAS